MTGVITSNYLCIKYFFPLNDQFELPSLIAILPEKKSLQVVFVLFCVHNFTKDFQSFFLYTTESLGNILWKHLKFECEKERSHCQAHNYNCRNLPFPKQAQNFCTNTCHILIICLAFWIMYHVKILDITICRLLFINMYKFFGRSKSIVNINIFIFL